MYIPLIGGFTAYPVVIIKCGRLPIVTTTIMGAYVYIEPDTNGYGNGIIFSTMETYMCTPREAGEQGYHKAI